MLEPGETTMNGAPSIRYFRNQKESSPIKKIGDKLKQDCAPCDAWVFSGNIPALKQFGLKPNKKIKLMNGKLDAELRNFDIYTQVK